MNRRNLDDFYRSLRNALDSASDAVRYIEDIESDFERLDNSLMGSELAECLEFGLPHIEHKYGHASNEARIVREQIVELRRKYP